MRTVQNVDVQLGQAIITLESEQRFELDEPAAQAEAAKVAATHGLTNAALNALPSLYPVNADGTPITDIRQPGRGIKWRGEYKFIGK